METMLAVLAMVFSVISVVLSGWFSIRAARTDGAVTLRPVSPPEWTPSHRS